MKNDRRSGKFRKSHIQKFTDIREIQKITYSEIYGYPEIQEFTDIRKFTDIQEIRKRKKYRNNERLFCSDCCFKVIILSEKSYKDSEFCQRTDHSGHLRNT